MDYRLMYYFWETFPNFIEMYVNGITTYVSQAVLMANPQLFAGMDSDSDNDQDLEASLAASNNYKDLGKKSFDTGLFAREVDQYLQCPQKSHNCGDGMLAASIANLQGQYAENLFTDDDFTELQKRGSKTR